MDRADLVFSIVCDSNVGKIFKKEEVAALMLVSKDCVGCELLKDSICVYKARYLLEQLHSKTISLVFAKNKGETQKVEQLEQTEKEILQSALEVQDFFIMGLMADYKEKVYDSKTDAYFSSTDDAMMCEYKRIVNTVVGDDDAVYNHIHDPNHPIFQDGNKHYYCFYEEYEINEASIFDVYYDEEDEYIDGDYDIFD